MSTPLPVFFEVFYGPNSLQPKRLEKLPGRERPHVKEKLVHSEKPHDPRTGHNSKQATTCQEKEKCSLL